MDKTRFFTLMEDLAATYTDNRLIEEKTVNVWYKYLNEYPIEILEDAVDGWIKSQTHRPSIAELREQCLRLPEMFPDKYNR